MLATDELFQRGDRERIWQKYCGFLDLSLGEFMEIQEELLMQQVNLVYDSPLAKRFMPRKPEDLSEFRQLVPLTTFDDYAAHLNKKDENVLAVKPNLWARTSGRGDIPKWIPYTQSAIDRLAISTIGIIITACTDEKGKVNVGPGIRILANLPPPPYITGILIQIMAQQLEARIIPPLEKYTEAEFEAKVQDGFQIALRTGVDILSSLTTVLVKMGERFAERSGQMRLNRHMLHPQIVRRLIVAYLRSKRQKRAILPKDLWPLKGLAAYGTDTAIYRDQLIHYWGKKPMEMYGSTETGPMAAHAWNKKSMTFIPYASFLEFIPEDEHLKSRENRGYQPSTVLLNEVKSGECYEVVITNFYGMPLLRYRLGDLIKIVALEDDEAGIKLPQMAFESRIDDLIDIGGFIRLDEKTVWQAIANTGVKHKDWSIRKEYKQNEPVLRLYIELDEEIEVDKLEELIHQELVTLYQEYKSLENLLAIRPLKITALPSGSFQRYYRAKQAAGADLAHLKPPHMNASDSNIRELLG